MDVFSVIMQSGLKLEVERNEIYQFSDNLTFQFVRDNKYEGYTLAAYIRYLDKVYGLEVKDDNTFNIDSRFLDKKEEFELSFSLTKSDKIIHLGTVLYRVKEAFGSTTSPLPEQKEIWEALVEKKIDSYFEENFQPKLDDFNSKKVDFDTKYQEVLKKATEVANAKSSVDAKAKEVAADKEIVQQHAKNVADQVNSFNSDYLEKKTEFNGIVTDSKNEINSLKDDSKQELEEKKQEISDNLDAQYAQFDEYMNRLNAMGIVVVDDCLCMYDEEEEE